jgi:anti-anti-sigma regulatory factor
VGATTPGGPTPAQAAASILDQLQARRVVVMGRLRIGREGQVTVVRFNDVYLVEGAEVALVRKELGDDLSQPNLRVLLDFKNVQRMSTAAVVMVDGLCSRVRGRGGSVALCRMWPEIAGILGTLALHNHTRVFPDKPTALAVRW